MKKKDIEKLAEERLKKIENLEVLLGNRRTDLVRLKGELQAKDEIIGILESIIYQLVEEKGCVEVSREKISEGIRRSFSLEVKDDVFVLTSKE